MFKTDTAATPNLKVSGSICSDPSLARFPSDSPDLIMQLCLHGVPTFECPATDRRQYILYQDRNPAVDHLDLPLWYSESAEYVLHNRRLGPRVRLDGHHPGEHTQSRWSDEIIAELVEAREKLLSDSSPFKRRKQEIKIHVLETCLNLVRANNDQLPAVANVVAALLLRPGLGGAQGVDFKDCMAHMEFRARARGRNPGIIPWHGEPSWYTRGSSYAVTIDGRPVSVLSAMISRLQRAAGGVSTLSELCDNLTPHSRHLPFYANAALQIADILGIARKWPPMLNPQSKKSESAWCSATHAPIKTKYRNVLIDMLERAYAGELDTISLLTTDSDQATYVRRTVDIAQGLLIKHNLLKATNPSQGTIVQITDTGRDLIDFWIRTEIGHALDIHKAESLRKTILELHSSNQNKESA